MSVVGVCLWVSQHLEILGMYSPTGGNYLYVRWDEVDILQWPESGLGPRTMSPEEIREMLEELGPD